MSFKEALAVLGGANIRSRLGFSATQSAQSTFMGKPALAVEKEKSRGTGFEIKAVTSIRSPALLQYLDSRCIDHDIAGRYLKEIRFCPKWSVWDFFALGWPNGDGYEARSAKFKGFVGAHKDISRIGLDHGKDLAIFEGFFDFLAYLSYYRIRDFKSAAIILNSTSLRKRALEEIEYYGFNKVYLFLDNDAAGMGCTDFFQRAVEELKVVDKSKLYSGFDDFNAMAMASLG